MVFKRSNFNNGVNKFSQCLWFGTLCYSGSFTEFLTCTMSGVNVLTLYWIRPQQNLGACCGGTVIVLPGGFKRLGVIINSDICICMFVLCGLDTGWVWMISSVASCTAEFVLEYASVNSDSLLYISMFPLNLSWICEEDNVDSEGSLETPGYCLFCLTSSCARKITLAMVDTQWYFVADFEMTRLKITCWIFIYISNNNNMIYI